MDRKNRKTIYLHLIIVLVIILSITLSNIFSLSCPVKEIIGFPCPTCGMTRSGLAFLKLDFRSSFYYNPLTVPAFFFFLFARHKDLFKIKVRTQNGLLIVGSCILFIVYIYRVFLVV